ncbi:hypothetical protein HMPREF1093_01658 [Hungatella hathewayi 12489931]|nr:hypothetical protein HMPREF1093_01658 [Hungatella hathewayi 12489931]
MEQNNLLTQSEICLIQPSEQYQHELWTSEKNFCGIMKLRMGQNN